jgi:uracil-DNA glycosylase
MDKKWQILIAKEREQTYFKKLEEKIDFAYKKLSICPPKYKIYRALELTPFDKVKVVIIGQDPYHGVNQANGLAFAVDKGVKVPQSLNNIFKELHFDLGISLPTHGDLTNWTKQGVLLLNTVLTVELGKPMSHKDWGWEGFTRKIIETLGHDNNPKVFVLWGQKAQSLETLINKDKHLILKAPHPSPLSAYSGFFESRPFSQTNKFLLDHNIRPINWELE